MADFSELRSSNTTRSNIPHAVLAPAVATIASDGYIDDAEVAQLTNLVAFSPVFSGLGAADLDDMTNAIMDDVTQKGAEAVIDTSAEVLSPALRETAFCFAMRVAMADGFLDEKEKDVLAGTAQRMQLSRETFENVLHVITMMQRPASA